MFIVLFLLASSWFLYSYFLGFISSPWEHLPQVYLLILYYYDLHQVYKGWEQLTGTSMDAFGGLTLNGCFITSCWTFGSIYSTVTDARQIPPLSSKSNCVMIPVLLACFDADWYSVIDNISHQPGWLTCLLRIHSQEPAINQARANTPIECATCLS